MVCHGEEEQKEKALPVNYGKEGTPFCSDVNDAPPCFLEDISIPDEILAWLNRSELHMRTLYILNDEVWIGTDQDIIFKLDRTNPVFALPTDAQLGSTTLQVTGQPAEDGGFLAAFGSGAAVWFVGKGATTTRLFQIRRDNFPSLSGGNFRSDSFGRSPAAAVLLEDEDNDKTYIVVGSTDGRVRTLTVTDSTAVPATSSLEVQLGTDPWDIALTGVLQDRVFLASSKGRAAILDHTSNPPQFLEDESWNGFSFTSGVVLPQEPSFLLLMGQTLNNTDATRAIRLQTSNLGVQNNESLGIVLNCGGGASVLPQELGVDSATLGFFPCWEAAGSSGDDPSVHEFVFEFLLDTLGFFPFRGGADDTLGYFGRKDEIGYRIHSSSVDKSGVLWMTVSSTTANGTAISRLWRLRIPTLTSSQASGERTTPSKRPFLNDNNFRRAIGNAKNQVSYGGSGNPANTWIAPLDPAVGFVTKLKETGIQLYIPPFQIIDNENLLLYEMPLNNEWFFEVANTGTEATWASTFVVPPVSRLQNRIDASAAVSITHTVFSETQRLAVPFYDKVELVISPFFVQHKVRMNGRMIPADNGASTDRIRLRLFLSSVKEFDNNSTTTTIVSSNSTTFDQQELEVYERVDAEYKDTNVTIVLLKFAEDANGVIPEVRLDRAVYNLTENAIDIVFPALAQAQEIEYTFYVGIRYAPEVEEDDDDVDLAVVAGIPAGIIGGVIVLVLIAVAIVFTISYIAKSRRQRRERMERTFKNAEIALDEL
ncbi:hypothetical protein QOT17_019494 [Balamuthia mandrillaris]